MKHIKKFETLNSANGFVIPKPFVGCVSEGGQVINCNEEGKKIKVEGGQVIVEDALQADYTKYITFTRNDNGQQITAYRYIGEPVNYWDGTPCPEFIDENGQIYFIGSHLYGWSDTTLDTMHQGYEGLYIIDGEDNWVEITDWDNANKRYFECHGFDIHWAHHSGGGGAN